MQIILMSICRLSFITLTWFWLEELSVLQLSPVSPIWARCIGVYWEYTKVINLLIKFVNFFHHFKSMTIFCLHTFVILYIQYVTMDHKTSLKCQFFETEMYTSSKSRINNFSIDVWFVMIGQFGRDTTIRKCGIWGCKKKKSKYWENRLIYIYIYIYIYSQ